MNTKMIDIAIVGAGASGLMAALPLAAYSREHLEEQPAVSVALIERNHEAGRKLALTGNGRCNFTNEYALGRTYDTQDEETFRAVIGRVTPEEVRSIFEQYGIGSVPEEDGRYYPAEGDASSVRDLLEEGTECEDVERVYNFKVKTIERVSSADWISGEESGYDAPSSGNVIEGDYFRLTAETGEELLARSVILATGGKACPKSGSQGDGYRLARSLGHTVVPTHPALVRLTHEDPILKDVKGVRVKGSVALYRDGELLEEARGEIQINPGLLSGICVMDVSHNVYDAQNHSFDCVLTFDGGQMIPERLKEAFVSALGEEPAADYLEQEKPYTVTVTGTQGWKEAQVTAGGVSLSETDPYTLESTLCPGLYFAGELLDVAGPCGGYNLHWAWASGFLAGMSALKRVIGDGNALVLQMMEEEELEEEVLL